MKVIEDLREMKALSPSAVALGNFDGVHLGHQELIKNMVNTAREKNLNAVVFTFSNHPRNLLPKAKKVKNILYKDEKAQIIESLGVDYMVSVEFTKQIMNMEPQDFIDELLIDKLNMKEAFCGFNYRFGHRAAGNPDFLRQAGKAYGFNVTEIEPFSINGNVVSSSMIRTLIAGGRVEDCKTYMGRNYAIGGEVVVGNRLGRTLGFPTSNLVIDPDMVTPPNGVYVTYCTYNGVRYPSVTNVGVKPTIGHYKKNVETHIFNFDKETDSLEVWYDQKQMQKVVNNLLSNAIKHTKAEDTITLGIRTEGSNAVIRVCDTGSGIDAKEIDKIFDRFYQIDPVDSKDANKEGTGIGLALTKGIVELHHGSIRVESELGKGTSFIVTLPLGNAHFAQEELSKQTEEEPQEEIIRPETPIALPQEELEEAAPLKQLSDAKILIVEDNESIREMLANIFKPFYQVITAADGEEGLELVRKEMPNIVVSDVVMPRMSGTDLCKQIKADFNTCHIPVVLLTARTTIEQNIEGLRIGADDYITKPFNTSLLISRCNNLVNSRVLLQEKFSKQPQAAVQMLATNPIDKDLLDRAMEIIEKHIDDTEFNVTVFAREMAMARTNLFAKLKAITGQTPNEFVLTIRLKKGALMLRNNPELNITEISDRIGFSSSRYFSKCFKDVYHVSPLAYRKGENGENSDSKGNEDKDNEETS